jgi:Mg-chelatase subunit ChlD
MGSNAPTGGTATKPLRMVFVYDRSGSMGDDPNNSPPGWQNSATRWIPMKQGMVDFLKSAPPTLEASIAFFPAIGATTKSQVCQGNYTDPSVPLTSDTQRVIDEITKARPDGTTPTLSALSGAVGYAQRVREADPSIPIMIVLVTDGEPAFYNATTGQTETDCAPLGSSYTNTIGDIEAFLRSRPDTSIPVHVLGIGEAQGDMTTIATAGGGKFVYLNDPSTFASSLRSILQ